MPDVLSNHGVFLRQGWSVTEVSDYRWSWLQRSSRYLYVPCPTDALGFSVGYWDPNLGPHAYVLNTLAQRAISPPHALSFETGSHYAVQRKNFLETLESPWVANDSLEPTVVLPPLPGS